jgi:hypothetical protein
VYTPAVPAKHLPDHDLSGNSLVLGEKRPAALQPVLDPFRVADLFRVVREVIADGVNDPASLDQESGRAFAEAPIGKELRRRLG